MLELTGQNTIHHKNLHSLALEVFKSLNGLNPDFMQEFYTFKTLTNNLRGGKMLTLPPENTLNSWLYRSALLWNNLPRKVKDSSSVPSFKNSLLECQLYCQCTICR